VCSSDLQFITGEFTSGVGDIRVGYKYQTMDDRNIADVYQGSSIGLEAFLPSGDETQALGSGSTMAAVKVGGKGGGTGGGVGGKGGGTGTGGGGTGGGVGGKGGGTGGGTGGGLHHIMGRIFAGGP